MLRAVLSNPIAQFLSRAVGNVTHYVFLHFFHFPTRRHGLGAPEGCWDLGDDEEKTKVEKDEEEDMEEEQAGAAAQIV